MARTQAERSRQKRLVGKVAAKERLTPDEAAFFNAYKRGEELPGTHESAGATIDVDAPPDTAAPDTNWKPFEGSSDAPPPIASPEVTVHKPKCTIPNCPGCAGRDIPAAQICGTTGREVWPPIGDGAANMIASVVFFIAGWMLKVAYKLDEIPEPTKLQREELANALKLIVQRRAGFLGAWDDLLGAGGALLSYQQTAKRRKEPAKEIPPS